MPMITTAATIQAMPKEPDAWGWLAVEELAGRGGVLVAAGLALVVRGADAGSLDLAGALSVGWVASGGSLGASIASCVLASAGETSGALAAGRSLEDVAGGRWLELLAGGGWLVPLAGGGRLAEARLSTDAITFALLFSSFTNFTPMPRGPSAFSSARTQTTRATAMITSGPSPTWHSIFSSVPLGAGALDLMNMPPSDRSKHCSSTNSKTVGLR
jgi:hypothetical protein